MGLVRGWSVLLVVAFACGRTDLDLEVPRVKVAPPEQTVRQGEAAAWTATASNVGMSPSFSWRLFARPAEGRAVLSATGPAATLRPDQPGDWVIELQVQDEGRLSVPAAAVLHVQPVSPPMNHAPVANAGVPRVIALGQSVTLDGSRSSDVDGDPLTFTWSTRTSPGSILVLFPSGGAPTITPPRAGRYEFQLTVTDPLGASDSATVAVDVLSVDAGAPDAGFDAGFDAGIPISDTLDAGDIYLVGTLMEGSCAQEAFTNLMTPNVASVGFDCNFDEETAMIRPTDGRLIYRNSTESFLREYHCDDCSYRGTYPMGVLTNDTVIPTPCSGGGQLADFLVSVEGEVLHRCSSSLEAWRSSGGSPVLVLPQDGGVMDSSLRGLGAQGWAITREQVINWQTGIARPIVGFPPQPFGFLTTRWAPPDAFRVVIGTGPGIPEELWSVSTAGVAQRLGSYGALPPNTIHIRGGRLDGAGRFFHIARNVNQNFVDLVARREVGGSSAIVYTESSNPLVKIQVSGLVTGP